MFYFCMAKNANLVGTLCCSGSTLFKGLEDIVIFH